MVPGPILQRRIGGISATAAAACAVADRCGGCPLIHRHPDSQARIKSSQLARLLAARGLPVQRLRLDLVRAGPALGYRNRLRLQVTAGMVRFFNRNKSFDCAVLAPDVRATIERLVQFGPACELGGFQHLEVRAMDLDGRASVYLVAAPEAQDTGSAGGALERRFADMLIGVRGSGTLPQQRYAIAGELFTYVPLGSFMQVNPYVNAALVEHVVSGARRRSLSDVLDLYCGSGNFALALCHAGLTGTGVETDAAAVTCASRAAEEQQLDCRFIAAPVTDCWQRAPKAALVVADPPRAGLRDTAPHVAELAKSHVVLCSCNPETLSRDIAAFVALGFELEELTGFDMFPQTAHLEAVAWLKKLR